MFFLGVDMGGTKSHFTLCDGTGRIITETVKGPGNYISLTREKFTAVFKEGIVDICTSAGIARADIRHAGIGCAGYGEVPGSEKSFNEVVAATLGHHNITAANDAVIGWAGSLGLEAGINMIAGTGSICFGMNDAGESARVGGWGLYCDEGSGQWIGEQTINAFVRMSDGRLPRTRLYELFREHFKLEDDLLFCTPLNSILKSEVSEVAKIQFITLAAYNEGDPYAIKIYERAAEEIALQIRVARDKLHFPAQKRVKASYSGGVFKAGECILAPLRANLNALNIELVPPLLPPHMGAVLLAMRDGGAAPDAAGIKAINHL